MSTTVRAARRRKGSQSEGGPADWLSLREGAAMIGCSPSSLSELKRRYQLLVPAIAGLPEPDLEQGPVRGRRVGARYVRYHREQLRLWLGVAAGNVAMETALMEWELLRREIGRRPVGMIHHPDTQAPRRIEAEF